MEYVNNMIIITTSNRKAYHIKNLSDKLLNVKVFTVEEFLREYYFSYKEDTWFYVSNKYKLKPNVTLYYLNCLYYLNDLENDDSNYLFLKDLKDDLLKNNYLVFNPLFKSFLENKKVVLDNINTSVYFNRLKEIGEVINYDNSTYEPAILEFKNTTEEVIFVLSEVIKLYDSGIPLSNIYLTNITKEYEIILKNYLDIFKIPNNFLRDSIISTNIIHYFLNGIDDINSNLLEVSNLIKSPLEQEIYNILVNTLNKYTNFTCLKDIKELLIEDLKSLSITPVYQDSINIVDIDYPFTDKDYVFMLGFNEENIPHYQTGNNFFSDELKVVTNLLTNKDINSNLVTNIIKMIKGTKNLVISYKLLDCNIAYYPSDLINELNLTIKTPEFNYQINNLVNKIKYVDALDTFRLYQYQTEPLSILSGTYPNLYLSYNHKYKKISKNILSKYVNHLRLSYSSVDTFYHCQFRYYLQYILKINYEEQLFFGSIGTIFHAVLAEYQKKDFNFSKSYETACKSIKRSFDYKEQFFLKMLKEDLKLLIDYIIKSEELTNLNQEYHELNITIPLNKDIDFTGYIDKIKTNKEHTITSIIDYKTGNPNLDLGLVKNGLNMQLPIYAYLVKHNEEFKDTKIGGIYLQHIFNGSKSYKPGKTIIDQMTSNWLLQGYSNEEISIISEFDKTYLSSRMIKSLSVTNNGEFSHYAKILNNETIYQLTTYVERLIMAAGNKILDGEFTINPHKVGLNDECANCPFKAVCFKDSTDTIWLEEIDNLDYLKEVK